MDPNNYQISKIEMSVTLISMIIGVGILTLPRALATSVGTPDGWISVIIGALLTMVLIYFIARLHRHFPGETLFTFVSQCPNGKWIGQLLTLLFIVHFLALLSYEARILTIVIRMFLLPETPADITAAVVFLATTYAVTKGLQGIVHLNLMFLPIVLSMIFLILMFSMGEGQLDHLRPIVAEGIQPVLLGVSDTVLSYAGIEILFFFIAFMKLKDIKAIPINGGIAVVTIFYMLVVTISYSVLTVVGTEVVVFPLVTLSQELEIVQGIIERMEPLLITVWIMTIFNTMAICHFLATRLIKDVLIKKPRISTIAISITFFSFMISFIPNSIQETFTFGGWISYFALSITMISLIIGYVFVVINKKSQKQKGSEMM
ncbi:hypothetical protein BKP45_04445 [Anaerobacillus alkalidiazotrophicus]|uniref:Uncharacterized protein n=1 Tax=Anaerobacillus alkalidiazotrophicus TaxID=472963 RepID=A0A1S2MBG8_9BACI|nr:GerAB/ArcD/ProY family transporter [Anaerobacillus alkalidiazotrophicus]OIJ21934.1 hypothetical protein BKP45_04445 [Anaerobacillus alkalidiazotrophicus]